MAETYMPSKLAMAVIDDLLSPPKDDDDDDDVVDHVDKRMAAIGELYLDSTTSDVTIVIGDDRLPAHKCILISASPYFE